MSPVKNLVAVLAMSLAAASVTHAEDGFSYRLSGFGTLGYAATDTNDVLLTNPNQIRGARENGSILVDSRIGGQLDLNFNQLLSATTQVVAKQDAKGDFRPQLEWAFLRYKMSDSTTLRVGRLGFPAYLVSDYRYVGYANPWARAPQEVYKLAPIDYFEGADISWQHSLADGYLTVQALVGHMSAPIVDTRSDSGRMKVNQLTGGYITYEIGNLRVRGGLSTGLASQRVSGADQLFAGLNQAGLDNVVDLFRVHDSRATFTSLGATYDANNILLMGEYGQRSSTSRVLDDAYGWYGTFGYRLGKWMPYVTYAGYGKSNQTGGYTIPASNPLSVGVDSLAAGNSQHTVSLGVRVDVRDNVAIKAQIDHVLPSTKGGTFSGVAADYNGHSVNIFSVVADFVF